MYGHIQNKEELRNSPKIKLVLLHCPSTEGVAIFESKQSKTEYNSKKRMARSPDLLIIFSKCRLES